MQRFLAIRSHFSPKMEILKNVSNLPLLDDSTDEDELERWDVMSR